MSLQSFRAGSLRAILVDAKVQIRPVIGLLTFAGFVGGPLALLMSRDPQFLQTPKIVSAELALGREGVLLAIVGLATFAMGLIERRSVWSFGLAGRSKSANFALGLVFGFTCLSALVACLVATSHLVLTFAPSTLEIAFTRAPAWVLCFLVVAATEEMLFRGYLQTTLAPWLGFWPAAASSSILFGLTHLHNDSEASAGIAVVILGGVLFSFLLKRTGSLWCGIGFHTAWDWGQSFFYGTPDSGIVIQDKLLRSHPIGPDLLSGGSVGPEGSVFIIPIFLLALAAIALTPKRDQPAIALEHA
jgi:membrane protease YdiL (CAAX protease family)